MVKYLIPLLMAAPAFAETTYLVDVLPIVDKRCAVCHVEITNYKTLRANASVLLSDKAREFLTPKEQKIIKLWIVGGMKK